MTNKNAQVNSEQNSTSTKDTSIYKTRSKNRPKTLKDKKVLAASSHSNPGTSKIRHRSSLYTKNSSNSIKKSYHSSHPNKSKLSNSIADQDYEDEEEDSNSTDGKELTVKDRQEIINQTHPFGLPLWKPALYKKSRTITRKAKTALHAIPTSEYYITLGNLCWFFVFGLWIGTFIYIIGVFMRYIVPKGGKLYGRVYRNLGWYLLWPFGKYIQKVPMSSFKSYKASTLANNSEEERLLQSECNTAYIDRKHSQMIEYYNQSKENRFVGKAVFYTIHYLIISPILLSVAAICWLLIVTVPMARLNYIILRKTRKIPLQLYFGKGSVISGTDSQNNNAQNARDVVLEMPQETITVENESRKSTANIILCTYHAMGLQYFKYTYDGINILFINLLIIVVMILSNAYIVEPYILKEKSVSTMTVFVGCLVSTIPLAYFIGMSVSSISAQSSLGMGAVINATFGSVVEILLYSFALVEGKAKLVEGSIIGSFLAGMLLMPGVSMISGAFKKKQQSFNAKSASVTSTMLIMSIIGVFTPTLFYQIYGSFKLECTGCPSLSNGSANSSLLLKCHQCMFKQTHPSDSSFYNTNVKPLVYICITVLPTAYVICLWFTLKTHTKHIYEKKKSHKRKYTGTMRSLYNKIANIHILDQILPNIQIVHHNQRGEDQTPTVDFTQQTKFNTNDSFPRHLSIETAQPKKNANSDSPPQYRPLIRIITTESQKHYRSNEHLSSANGANQDAVQSSSMFNTNSADNVDFNDINNKYYMSENESEEEGAETQGHDAPEWSKLKSSMILFSCTVLFAMVAELMVSSVDSVVEKFSIDEKFLGLTLFALVPNVTEFSNAILFALYGNISLSMEIGSAYAVQVSLLQIPAVVAISTWINRGNAKHIVSKMFTLIFPKLDMVAVFFSVFLLSYIYIEGKTNYFKGSILVLTYFVWASAFFYEPPVDGTAGVLTMTIN